MNSYFNFKKIILILIMCSTLVALTACNKYEWEGKSKNWSVNFTYSSDNETGKYTIKYIGEESKINGFSYQFNGSVLTAFGGEEKAIESPFQVTQKVSGKDYIKEKNSVNLKESVKYYV